MAKKTKIKQSTSEYEYPEPPPSTMAVHKYIKPPVSLDGLKNMYQTVYLTFSDGTVGAFTGPAVVHPCLIDDVLCVIDTKFSVPKELPAGVTFDKIGDL